MKTKPKRNTCTVAAADLTWLRGWAKRGIKFEQGCSIPNEYGSYYADQLKRLKGVGK